MSDDRRSADEVSEETRVLLASVRARAASAPGAADLADLIARAGERSGTGVTHEDVRRLGTEAIEKAREVSYLLGRLAGVAGDGGHG